ncbi:MAG: hypothetical protein Q8O19_04660 [Rectinemataceae bacterium]|nr:hypothetical protein [Rectinemataceae bacterium]
MTPTDVSKKYFEFLTQIEQAERQGDYPAMLRLCFNSLPLISLWVEHEVREYGGFDPKCIPAIEVACKYLGYVNDLDGIERVEKVVKGSPHLEAWQKTVDSARQTGELAQKVFEHIEQNPGCIQSKLADELGMENESVRELCYYLERTGNLRREKSGRSYALFVKEG